MTKNLLVVLCAFCLAFGLSCNPKSSGSRTKKTETRFDFGRSTTIESLRATIANILRKYNHDLRGSDTFIETEYRNITPVESEEVQGIKEVRYKISVNMSARRNISAAEARLQCEGRYETGEWAKINPSTELVEFVKNMQDEIKQELQRYLPQW